MPKKGVSLTAMQIYMLQKNLLDKHEKYALLEDASSESCRVYRHADTSELHVIYPPVNNDNESEVNQNFNEALFPQENIHHYYVNSVAKNTYDFLYLSPEKLLTIYRPLVPQSYNNSLPILKNIKLNKFSLLSKKKLVILYGLTIDDWVSGYDVLNHFLSRIGDTSIKSSRFLATFSDELLTNTLIDKFKFTDADELEKALKNPDLPRKALQPSSPAWKGAAIGAAVGLGVFALAAIAFGVLVATGGLGVPVFVGLVGATLALVNASVGVLGVAGTIAAGIGAGVAAIALTAGIGASVVAIIVNGITNSRLPLKQIDRQSPGLFSTAATMNKLTEEQASVVKALKREDSKLYKHFAKSNSDDDKKVFDALLDLHKRGLPFGTYKNYKKDPHYNEQMKTREKLTKYRNKHGESLPLKK